MKKYFLLFLFSLFIVPGFGQQTVGLFLKTAASEDGYVLFPPMRSHGTYLIDKCGREVHSWTSAYEPGFSAYLTTEGLLLRPAAVHNTLFARGGSGGLIEELDWNSNKIWSYGISSQTECQHHDVCYLPNGNILAIAWELKTDVEGAAVGRDPKTMMGSIWPDKIVELKPTGINSATIVWEWHAWDHLVQDFDSSLPGYGAISDHPELLNINQTDGNPMDQDWLHINTVAYNKDLDQIMLSCFYFNELWVIDHSTTTQEAQSHSGGKSGKGGDILYRWGNPQAYGRGTVADQKFYRQHDAHWIAPGLPDAGKIIVFNNGDGRPQGDYSTIEIIDPPVDPAGNYLLANNAAYLPRVAYWQYKAANPTDFFANLISGADRLKSGNTLICEGTKGHLFEVDNAGHIVWDYINPVGITGPTTQGHLTVQNDIFRARQYPAGYGGFKNHTLTPGAPLELKPTPGICDKVSPAAVSNLQSGTAGFRVVNPFENDISLQSETGGRDIQVSLINTLGFLCGRWKVDMEAGKMNRLTLPENLPAGTYLLHILNGGTQAALKLIKE